VAQRVNRRIRLAVIASVIAIIGAASPCLAQEHNRFALGINYTHRLSHSDELRAKSGVGIKWRIGHSDSGWGPHLGLGWFKTDLERNIAGQRMKVGELRVRSFVGGYGYTHSFSPKLHVTGDLVGGFAFTTFEVEPEDDSALDSAEIDADVSRVIPVVRPEVTLWYDIRPKFGLSLGAGYTIARPKLAITTAGTRTNDRVNADTFAITAGLVYRLF
jgi:hypothetical protein